MHFATFRALSTLIERDVIGNSKAMLATSLLDLYKSEFLSAGGTTDDIEGYQTQALMKKIREPIQRKKFCVYV